MNGLTDPRKLSDEALLKMGPAAMAAMLFSEGTPDGDHSASVLAEIQRRGLI